MSPVHELLQHCLVAECFAHFLGTISLVNQMVRFSKPRIQAKRTEPTQGRLIAFPLMRTIDESLIPFKFNLGVPDFFACQCVTGSTCDVSISVGERNRSWAWTGGKGTPSSYFMKSQLKEKDTPKEMQQSLPSSKVCHCLWLTLAKRNLLFPLDHGCSWPAVASLGTGTGASTQHSFWDSCPWHVRKGAGKPPCLSCKSSLSLTIKASWVMGVKLKTPWSLLKWTWVSQPCFIARWKSLSRQVPPPIVTCW